MRNVVDVTRIISLCAATAGYLLASMCQTDAGLFHLGMGIFTTSFAALLLAPMFEAVCKLLQRKQFLQVDWLMGENVFHLVLLLNIGIGVAGIMLPLVGPTSANLIAFGMGVCTAGFTSCLLMFMFGPFLTLAHAPVDVRVKK